MLANKAGTTGGNNFFTLTPLLPVIYMGNRKKHKDWIQNNYTYGFMLTFIVLRVF